MHKLQMQATKFDVLTVINASVTIGEKQSRSLCNRNKFIQEHKTSPCIQLCQAKR